MNIVEGKTTFRGFETWYRVTGDLASSPAPVVVVHGGPGCTHDYVDSFKDLARDGRAVVHYDQLGNGRSTHLRDRGADFWTVELFLAELDNLLAHLQIPNATTSSDNPGAVCWAPNMRCDGLPGSVPS